ncbi:DUF6912 family protein [Ornithinimicrobium avium]|nr:hypothetical protein [Ornithinimicrobium avium]
MTTVRCYLPVTPEQLRRLRDERRLAGPLPAYAVTASVQAAHAGADLDEWEFVALQEAARSQLAGGAPVIVAAADVVEEGVRRREDRASGARVEVGDVDLPRVAALHLGDDVVTGRAGAAADGPQGIELSWYDTTEIAHVAELAAALDGTPAGD